MYGQSPLGDKVRNSLSPSVVATKSRLNDLHYYWHIMWCSSGIRSLRVILAFWLLLPHLLLDYDLILTHPLPVCISEYITRLVHVLDELYIRLYTVTQH